MDNYRIVRVGHDFVVFADDVSILKCQTEKDAEIAIAVALDLLEHPDDWWSFCGNDWPRVMRPGCLGTQPTQRPR